MSTNHNRATDETKALAAQGVDARHPAQPMPEWATHSEPNPARQSAVPIIYFKGERPACSARTTGWTPDAPKICSQTKGLAQNGRCRTHGGKTPVGLDAQAFKTGKFSKELPARYLARYQESINDTDLTSLKDEIAVIDARVSELFRTADEGGGQKIFKDLTAIWQVWNQAVSEQNEALEAQFRQKLADTMVEGNTDRLVWEEIDSLFERKRKLCLAEANRMKLLDLVIPTEKVQVLLNALAAIVSEEVTDDAILSNIETKFKRLLRANLRHGG